MFAYRIADSRHPIFDPTGALLHGGRWSSPGHPVIYAAETYAGALLEVLVHANLFRVPRTHAVVRIHIPEGVQMETVLPSRVPGWDAEDPTASRAYGDNWIAERRSAVLRVPSVTTQGRECNLVLHTLHPQFPSLIAEPPEPVAWDRRLFRGQPSK